MRCMHQLINLRCEPLWVTRKQGRFANVVQLAKQHDYSLHANTSSAMWHCSKLECINVRLDAINGNAQRLSTFCTQTETFA